LSFVREAPPSLLADLPDDLDYLKRLQLVASGKECVSSLEASTQLILKADLPDNILSLVATSGDVVKWSYWYWKAWDVEYLIKRGQPAEAVPIEGAGISAPFLDSIIDQRSCIPFLENVEILLTEGSKQGYVLANEIRQGIQEREARLLATLRIAALKGLPSSGKRPSETHSESPVPIKTRERVLRRDNYRCIFCGATADRMKLEVNHIVPRSLIRKLNLSKLLFLEEMNLCTTCWPCNRSKSDTLHREDIQFYLQSFSNPNHPNNAVVPFLEAIMKLQALDP
jgi:hypothetical protein